MAGVVEAGRIALTLARELRLTRRRRRLTQRALGDRVGLGQTRISQLERGRGHSLPLEKWVSIGIALDRPFAAAFSPDIAAPEPRDAGHLEAQELILRLAGSPGRTGLFELASRPSDPARSTDVGIVDDRNRALILVEIWNRLDDLGRAVRDSDRKLVEASDVAAFRDPAYRVAACWLFVDTAANRALSAASRRSCAAASRVRRSAGSAPFQPARRRPPWDLLVDPRAAKLTPLRLRG